MKISKIKFGSLLSYTPGGDLKNHKRSRDFMKALKNDHHTVKSNQPFSEYAVQYIVKNIKNYPFATFFSELPTLIPIPKFLDAKR